MVKYIFSLINKTQYYKHKLSLKNKIYNIFIFCLHNFDIIKITEISIEIEICFFINKYTLIFTQFK